MQKKNCPNAVWAVALAIVFGASGQVLAQGSHSLAEKSQNPIGSLITFPIQNTVNFGQGDLGNDQNVTLFQPAAPFSVSPDYNLLLRPIVPLIYQPPFFAGDDTTYGIGDIQLQSYLVPKNVTPIPGGSIVFGAGPVFQFNSASDRRLGTGKWAAGAGAVVFAALKPFTVGALVNNIWSFAGSDDRADVNVMTVQPFVNYNMAGGWYLTSSPVITFDWESGDNTVPLGGGFGRIFKVGDQPVNAQVQAFGYAAKPDGGPDWSLRAQWTFLFPVGG